VVRLLAQPAFRSICEAVAIDGAGTPPEALGTDDEVDAWLLANLGDYVHAAGTCRLGRPDDPLAVVDPQARVIGVDGLYVADASIMPTVPRANPHLACVAVGERVAELLTP
jgi:choline dehydrogenase-like flavoprotein